MHDIKLLILFIKLLSIQMNNISFLNKFLDKFFFYKMNRIFLKFYHLPINSHYLSTIINNSNLDNRMNRWLDIHSELKTNLINITINNIFIR